jgi:hypothetical protein
VCRPEGTIRAATSRISRRSSCGRCARCRGSTPRRG